MLRRLVCCGALLAAAAARAAAPVQLEALTSPELHARIAAGATTVLVPIGATEQNGPHIALGKHNVRVALLAARIAEQLGDAIVAPTLAYTPDDEHLRWPGTISVPAPAFEAVLDGAAKSLRRSGFCTVVYLGDHGGYRASIERVVAALNRSDMHCRALALPEYYRAASADHAAMLQRAGHAATEIGRHAGLADTSLMLALDPSLVRADIAAARRPDAADGAVGDPRHASAELGRAAVEHIVSTSVAAIRGATRKAP